jgi:hypothetical protein
MSVHIQNLILKCDSISLNDKYKALYDIDRMKKYIFYCQHVDYDIFSDSLDTLFIFERSVLGAKFWQEIDAKINKNDNNN